MGQDCSSGDQEPDLSLVKVKVPVGVGCPPELISVAVQEARTVTGAEFGLHDTEVNADDEMIRSKEFEPPE
jgi:hypothetical protein